MLSIFGTLMSLASANDFERPSFPLSIRPSSSQGAGIVPVSYEKNNWSGEICCKLQVDVSPPMVKLAPSQLPVPQLSFRMLDRAIFFTSSMPETLAPAGNSVGRSASETPVGGESFELTM